MDESRKAFERWWEVNYHNGNPPRFGWEAWREGDGYKIDDDESELDGMWQAWTASRAAIEIKLDDKVMVEDEFDKGHNCAIDYCADAIRAAGIKVKE
ncbi:hypothetical protein [Enterobacter sp. HNGD-822]